MTRYFRGNGDKRATLISRDSLIIIIIIIITSCRWEAATLFRRPKDWQRLALGGGVDHVVVHIS